jgi:hypothetical protein
MDLSRVISGPSHLPAERQPAISKCRDLDQSLTNTSIDDQDGIDLGSFLVERASRKTGGIRLVPIAIHPVTDRKSSGKASSLAVSLLRTST